MGYVCLRSYLLDGELHYDNSITNQKRKICPIPSCDSPIVDTSDLDYSRNSFDQETEELDNIVDKFRRSIINA